jgi:hypothetical protein
LDWTFQEGDWVLLKLKPYRQMSMKSQQPFKLSRRFVGPFQVRRRIGEVAYELDLPSTAKIHHVFHVSKLRPYHGTPPSEPPTLPISVTSTAVQMEPQQLLGSRTLLANSGSVQQLLVQWKGLKEEVATWENLEEFVSTWPDYNLEDKIPFKGGSNVTKTKHGIIGGPGQVSVSQTEPLGRGKRETKRPK